MNVPRQKHEHNSDGQLGQVGLRQIRGNPDIAEQTQEVSKELWARQQKKLDSVSRLAAN